MPLPDPGSLWGWICAAGDLGDRFLWGAHTGVALGALESGSSLGGRLGELRGCSVLLAVEDQLPAALALIELDGVARRIVLCTPDVPREHLPAIVRTAEIDAIVADTAAPLPGAEGIGLVVAATPGVAAPAPERRAGVATEWVLLTSGTTGVPKLVLHTLATLTGPIAGSGLGERAVWSTFYDIRRYGGLQMFLRALLGGGSLVLSASGEPVAGFLARVGARGVSHISGTPSHWRRALMSPARRDIAPGYVRLSGEIADQAVLDHLRAAFPDADIAHAFASTEAGVAFAVGDGQAGFPASLIDRPGSGVEIRVADGSLRIRSTRNAARYLGPGGALAGIDGFVDTGDIVERRGDRYVFVGRRGGIINVGGQKVHPEEVESVINRHPRVRMSLVRARKNPITGALVVADVVARSEADAALRDEILAACRASLPRHKVPAAIRFVPALAVAASGKLLRPHA